MESMAEEKVACETAAPVVEDPYLPAESFRVRIGDEIGWSDLNAVYDREDSTRGGSNPKSHHHNSNGPHPNARPAGSSSQRFSGGPKAPILGLPNKIQHSGYLGRSARRLSASNSRIFPKRKAGAARAAFVEPGSPKVSCFGKVGSERERAGLRGDHRRPRPPPAPEKKEKAIGCWAGILRSIFGRNRRSAVEAVDSDAASPASARSFQPAAEDETAAAAAAPGLGGMRRFASGRRPASWGGDEEDGGHVAWSGPLGSARRSVDGGETGK